MEKTRERAAGGKRKVKGYTRGRGDKDGCGWGLYTRKFYIYKVKRVRAGQVNK